MLKSTLRALLGEAGYGGLVKFRYWLGWKLHRFHLALKNGVSIVGFLANHRSRVSLAQRFALLNKFRNVSKHVPCPHRSYEILRFVSHILAIGRPDDGVFVEAGCFKGGSSAKFSLALALVGKRLIVFDSFAGLPANEENYGRTIFGAGIAAFKEGAYSGGLEEVKSNIAKYGALDVCDFVKGWFDDTLPGFREDVLGAYIDVDLASSTRTCIRCLFPRIVPGGIMVSQDGHLPRVLGLLDDDAFWSNDVKCRKPRMLGFGSSYVVTMLKGP